ncbi:MAG: hypothetical protein ABI478_10900 [Propionivibrio sp.]
MNTILAVIVGIGAAVILLMAGWLLGIARGAAARDQLRTQEHAHSEDLSRLRAQLSQRRSEQEDSLKSTIEQLLSPLLQRDRLSFDLAHLDGLSGEHRDLNQLLGQIADKGNFTTVLLSDNQGWPLAASRSAKDIDRLGATTSLLMLIADRMSADQAPLPLSFMVHDAANMVTLCRIFTVGDHRLALTAVSPSTQLTCTALDPALVKIDAALVERKLDGA